MKLEIKIPKGWRRLANMTPLNTKNIQDRWADFENREWATCDFFGIATSDSIYIRKIGRKK